LPLCFLDPDASWYEDDEEDLVPEMASSSPPPLPKKPSKPQIASRAVLEPTKKRNEGVKISDLLKNFFGITVGNL